MGLSSLSAFAHPLHGQSRELTDAGSALETRGQRRQRHKRRDSKYDENKRCWPVKETVGDLGPCH